MDLRKKTEEYDKVSERPVSKREAGTDPNDDLHMFSLDKKAKELTLGKGMNPYDFMKQVTKSKPFKGSPTKTEKPKKMTADQMKANVQRDIESKFFKNMLSKMDKSFTDAMENLNN